MSEGIAKSSIWPNARNWWEALRWVLITFTVVIALAISGSFVSYEQVTTSGHPWLPQKRCTGCKFCGMTRSFCAMSNGRWQEAKQWNKGGPVLYTAGWLWLLGVAVIATRVVCVHYLKGNRPNRVRSELLQGEMNPTEQPSPRSKRAELG